MASYGDPPPLSLPPAPFSRHLPIELAARGLSGMALKYLAMLAMLIDHGAVALLEPQLLRRGLGLLPASLGAALAAPAALQLYWLLRLIGRLTMPIICFMVVEGLRHSRDPRRYALRLLLLALISEPCFDLVFARRLYAPGMQNTIFTLLLGLLLIMGLDRFGLRWPSLVFVVLCPLCAWLRRADYSWYGVALIALIWLVRRSRLMRSAVVAVAGLLQFTACLAAVPLYAYDGRPGRGPRRLFYLFYPAHLLLLALIARSL